MTGIDSDGNPHPATGDWVGGSSETETETETGTGLSRYTDSVHEMGIAIEVYRACRETIEEHGGGRLRGARLAVGELSAVEPGLLVYAWEAVVFDSSDAGAKLEIVWCPADQRCTNCGEVKERGEGSWMKLCPDCGMPLQVTGGNELDVLDLSFEEGGPGELDDLPENGPATVPETPG